MSESESDTSMSRAKRWAIRTGCLVASISAFLVGNSLVGILYAKFTYRIDPGASLLSHKLVSVLGGSYVVAALTLLVLLSSQWFRGKIIHLRQKEYDRTGEAAGKRAGLLPIPARLRNHRQAACPVVPARSPEMHLDLPGPGPRHR